jgi:endogenous inhibitor of DNA gyrase (YacG/DUF329 family)
MSKMAKRKMMRSGNVPCPTCNAEVKLCRHHINGREVPRAEEEWNIAWICPTCHDKVHDGEILIEGWFMTTDGGRELIWRKNGDKPITGTETTPPLY